VVDVVQMIPVGRRSFSEHAAFFLATQTFV
jgi:hypothetical protein